LINYIKERRTIGWRADGLGSPKHMNEIYPKGFPLLPKDLWKTAPVSFESYWWISEWLRQGWDIDKIIDLTLEYHVSTFNTKSFPIQYELQDKIEKWIERMGYRFVIKEVEYPEIVKAGETEKITLKIENKGVAPIYNKLPLKIRIKSEETQEYTTNVDITKWLPGEYEENISIEIPNEFLNGEYELQIVIGGGEYPNVQFANELERDGEFYFLTKIKIIENKEL